MTKDFAGQPTVGLRPTGPMRAVGRLLRVLRLASALTAENVAASADLGVRRIRDLEAGTTTLGFGEGLVLAKTYQLCATCFARHYRAAQARGGGLQEDDGDD